MWYHCGNVIRYSVGLAVAVLENQVCCSSQPTCIKLMWIVSTCTVRFVGCPGWLLGDVVGFYGVVVVLVLVMASLSFLQLWCVDCRWCVDIGVLT